MFNIRIQQILFTIGKQNLMLFPRISEREKNIPSRTTMNECRLLLGVTALRQLARGNRRPNVCLNAFPKSRKIRCDPRFYRKRSCFYLCLSYCFSIRKHFDTILWGSHSYNFTSQVDETEASQWLYDSRHVLHKAPSSFHRA